MQKRVTRVRVPSHLFNAALIVSRLSTTTDAGGGVATTWADVGTIRGRLSQPDAAAREYAASAQAQLDHVLHTHPRADVTRGDRLSGGGQTLEVVATMVPSEPVYLRVECVREQKAGS